VVLYHILSPPASAGVSPVPPFFFSFAAAVYSRKDGGGGRWVCRRVVASLFFGVVLPSDFFFFLPFISSQISDLRSYLVESFPRRTANPLTSQPQGVVGDRYCSSFPLNFFLPPVHKRCHRPVRLGENAPGGTLTQGFLLLPSRSSLVGRS